MIIICEICGYQWNDGRSSENEQSSVFFAFCPVCDSNLCHEMTEKENPEDGKLWY